MGAVGLSRATVTRASAASYSFHGYRATIVGTNGSNEINGTSDHLDGGASTDKKFQRYASERAEDAWEAKYRWDD